MKICLSFYLWVIVMIWSQVAFAQDTPQAEIEYLLKELALTKADSNKVNLLNELGWEYIKNFQYTKATPHFEEAFSLAKKINYLKGEAQATNYLGVIQQSKYNYSAAFNYYVQSLQLNEKIDYPKGIAFANQSIGSIYAIQGNHTDAIRYWQKALKIYERIGDNIGIAYIYNNIGTSYVELKQYEEAINSFRAGLELFTQLNYRGGMSFINNYIGNVYAQLKDYPRALEYFNTGADLAFEIKDTNYLMFSYLGKGQTQKKLGDFDQARKDIEKALSFSSGIDGKPTLLEEIYKEMSNLDSISGNWEAAYKKYKLYIMYRDSVKNEENTEATLRAQMEYDFDKKLAISKAEQEKKETRDRLIRNGMIGILAMVLLFLLIVYRQGIKTKKEKKRSEALLLNILPAEIAEELKDTGKAEARSFEKVSILFTDFQEFTKTSELLGARELVAEINVCFEAFDHIMDQYDIEKIKTIGDAYMAAGGLSQPTQKEVRKTVLAAIDMQTFTTQRKKERTAKGLFAFEMRVGIHTGPVVAGIVGVKKFQYDIWGDTVNIANRMETLGKVEKVNISQTTYELIKDYPDFVFKSRGKIEVKGKGEMTMWFVERRND